MPLDSRIVTDTASLVGPHCQPLAIDNWMRPLAEELARRVPDVPRFELSYDHREDFYHLRFEVGGHRFDVRYYKVFAVEIDGKAGWIGCPRYRISAFEDYLIQQIKQLCAAGPPAPIH